MTDIRISVQREDFDIGAEVDAVKRVSGDVGAVVSFSGICRNDGGTLLALELETYPGMVEEEIGRIAAEAAAKWPLAGIRIVHRYGRLAPGDNVVLVVAGSVHRHAAFEAASFLMDFMKTTAPFWKKEHLASSSGEWVAPRDSDDDASRRWGKK